jgi:hypothetical protein
MDPDAVPYAMDVNGAVEKPRAKVPAPQQWAQFAHPDA